MPVLVALNAADTATSIAELTDEQAVAEAMEVREGDNALTRLASVAHNAAVACSLVTLALS
jgi:hypothetical protein